MSGVPTIGIDTIKRVLKAGSGDGFRDFKEEQPALYAFLDEYCQKNKKTDDVGIAVLLYRLFKVEYERRELDYLLNRKSMEKIKFCAKAGGMNKKIELRHDEYIEKYISTYVRQLVNKLNEIVNWINDHEKKQMR